MRIYTFAADHGRRTSFTFNDGDQISLYRKYRKPRACERAAQAGG